MSSRSLGPPAFAALLGAACGGPSAERRGAGLAIDVAALSLSGVSDVCYSLAIGNDAGESVWSASDLCASRYGARGGISYVAPCDGTDTTGDGVATQTVTLTIDGLFGPGGPADRLEDYIDPCAAPHAPGGCTLSTACVENADTPVSFELTLMRRAYQGFFDVAVQFDDIFCSAKLDCLNAAGAPLRLLHHPTSGARAETVVVGLVCTTGSGGAATALLRDPLQVTCGAETTLLDPAFGRGNAFRSGSAEDPDPDDAVWQYAVYTGNETIDCGGAPCQTQYWNVAIGLDLTVAGCRLTSAATAIKASLAGFSTPDEWSYPVVTWDVPLTTAGPTPTLACSQHPLDGAPLGTSTTYTGLGVSRTFGARAEGDALARAACPNGWSGPACDVPPEVVTGDLIVSFDAVDPDSYPGTGTAWSDLSGNDLDGVLAGGVAYSSANQGTLVFDGANDQVIVANNNLLKNNAITIDLLIVFNDLRTDVYRDFVEFGVGSGNFAQYYFRQNAGGFISWEWYPVAALGTAVSIDTTSLVNGQAYHFALTGDALGNAAMYIDGELAATTSLSIANGTTQWTPAPLTIGGSTWDGFTASRISSFKLYRRALSPAEIQQNAAALVGRF